MTTRPHASRVLSMEQRDRMSGDPIRIAAVRLSDRWISHSLTPSPAFPFPFPCAQGRPDS